MDAFGVAMNVRSAHATARQESVGQRRRDIANIAASAAVSAATRARPAAEPRVPLLTQRNLPVTALGVSEAAATTRTFMPYQSGLIAHGLLPAASSTIASTEPLERMRMAVEVANCIRHAATGRRGFPQAPAQPAAQQG